MQSSTRIHDRVPKPRASYGCARTPSPWRSTVFKKFLAVASALLIAGGLAIVAVAAPASAHHTDLTASAACTTDGGWDVTWSVMNSENFEGKVTASNNAAVPVGSGCCGWTRTSMRHACIRARCRWGGGRASLRWAGRTSVAGTQRPCAAHAEVASDRGGAAIAMRGAGADAGGRRAGAADHGVHDARREVTARIGRGALAHQGPPSTRQRCPCNSWWIW